MWWNTHAGIPAGLVALVRGGVKEKVVRAGLLALKNLLGAAGLDLAPTLLDLGLHKLLALRSLQVPIHLFSLHPAQQSWHPSCFPHLENEGYRTI